MKIFFHLIIAIAAVLPLIVTGQADAGCASCPVAVIPQGDVNLFRSDELLKITLRFDITDLERKKTKEEYQDADLIYLNDQADSVVRKIRIKARGNVRRVICDLPPMALNFRTKDSLDGIFAGIDKIKMVSYCKLGYKELVLREYLIYKLYNALTDYSFNVRLLEVTFINTHKKSKPVKEYCFLIEPLKLLEKRKGLKEIGLPKVSQRNIRPDIMDRLAIFNYMIGNTDWSVPIQRNIEVLSESDAVMSSRGVAVPYDFDYAGLVDADYAVPYEGLPIKSVRERYYLGMCRIKSNFEISIREFIARKEEFYNIINEFPYLREKSKKQMISYLDGFYSKIDRKNTIITDMLNSCIQL